MNWESMSPSTKAFIRSLWTAFGMGAVTFFVLLAFDGISNREAWSLIGLQFFGALGFRTSEGALFDRRPKVAATEDRI